jgi:hypothetical protein
MDATALLLPRENGWVREEVSSAAVPDSHCFVNFAEHCFGSINVGRVSRLQLPHPSKAIANLFQMPF